jgi:hypothetical protein
MGWSNMAAILIKKTASVIPVKKQEVTVPSKRIKIQEIDVSIVRVTSL